MTRIGFKLNTQTQQHPEGHVYGTLGPASGDVYIVNGKEMTHAQMQREYSKVFERESEKMFERELANL